MSEILNKERLLQYALLMRLDKPIGIFLLLWPTLWGLWIASEGNPDGQVLFVFIFGVVLMRSAGCVINDFADREYDLHVERTKNRPLTAGKVTEKEALILFVVLCLSAFCAVLLLNILTIILSFGAVLLACIYPFMKRFTYLPQVVLGVAFSWSIPMVFAAQTNTVPKEAWLLFVAAIVWTTAYDTMYAMVDRNDDVKLGIKSTAILFGNMDRVAIALLQITIAVIMILIGYQLKLSLYYFAGLVLAAGSAVYQHALLKERKNDLYFRAFLHNNWFGAAIFLGIALHYSLYD